MICTPRGDEECGFFTGCGYVTGRGCVCGDKVKRGAPPEPNSGLGDRLPAAAPRGPE